MNDFAIFKDCRNFTSMKSLWWFLWKSPWPFHHIHFWHAYYICISYFYFHSYWPFYLKFNPLYPYIVVKFNIMIFVIISYACHDFVIFALFYISHLIEYECVLIFEFRVYLPSSTLSWSFKRFKKMIIIQKLVIFVNT